MNKYRTLLLNIGLFGINTVATKLITFLLVPLYTYYLSTKEFGITDMSLTVISLVLPIASMSISDAVLRFVIDDSNDQKSVVSYGLIVIGLSCAIVALLLPVLKLSVFGGLGNYSGYFLLMYVSTALMTYAGNVARGLNQIKIIPICASISTLITGISAYLLIVRQGIGIQGYFISVSAGPLVGTAIYTIVGKHYKYYSLRSLSGNVPLIKNMLVYALPLVPNTLFWWLGTSINRFFITGMLGIGASGLYAAASKIPNLLNLAYSIFQQAWQLSTFQEYRKSDIGKFFSMILIPLQAVLTVGASFIYAAKEFLFRVDVDSGCLARLLFQLYEYVLRNGLYHTDENEIPHDNHDSWLTGMRHRNSRVDSCSGTLWRRSSQHIMQRGDLCNAHDKFKTPCVNRCELLHIGYFHCAVRRADDDYCDGGSILLGLWRIDISRIDWHARYALCAFASACCRQEKQVGRMSCRAQL